LKILAIERLRAVAILMVYLIHVPLAGDAFGFFRPFGQLGTWAGVDLFFVISGFVVTLSLERLLPPRRHASLREPLSPEDRTAMRSFYVRRFFRLAPIAGCALFLHFVGSAIGPSIAPETPFLTLHDWGQEALAVVSGLYNFVAPYLTKPAMSFFWSLSVEEQFYLLLPAMFAVAGTRRTRILCAACVLLAIAVVIRPLFSPNHFALAHYSSQYRFDALAAGVLLGLERERITALVLRVPPSLRKALVLFSFMSLIYVSRHVNIWFAIHYGLVFIWAASAWLVACAAADGRDVLDLPVVNRVLEHIGSRSYAIYVIHMAFLMAADTLTLGASASQRVLITSRVGQTLSFVVTAALVLGAAELAYRYIELPCIRVGKRVVAARAAAKVAPEPAT
jgi:peptidoglycan/LPS O-acetylase OafA/YrhL